MIVVAYQFKAAPQTHHRQNLVGNVQIFTDKKIHCVADTNSHIKKQHSLESTQYVLVFDKTSKTNTSINYCKKLIFKSQGHFGCEVERHFMPLQKQKQKTKNTGSN